MKALKKLESIMKKTWVRRRRIMATIEVEGKKYKVTENLGYQCRRLWTQTKN